ncbi:MAG TPA: TetR/AcrR family transcriptional regulator [Frankiaceae bacterium]|jgi:AcrR family transcriptional regulator|nr:TetR/AcrR family transcriptional regulator [Frankiaceae bacterium]
MGAADPGSTPDAVDGTAGKAAPQRRSPAPRRPAVRREELLDAADTVIRRVGVKASAALIAQEAGVTKPIIYRHFGDLQDLYRALALRHQARLAYYLQAARESAGDVDHHTMTRTIMSAFFQAIEREPNLFRFLVQAPGDPADREGGQSWFVRRFAEQMAVYLAMEADEQLSPKFRAMGYAAAGAMIATGSWWIEDGTVPRADAVEALTSVMAAGIPPAAAGASSWAPERSA